MAETRNKHLEELPKSLRDQKSQESGFRKKNFWRPAQIDLLIRMTPLWMERVASVPEKNYLGAGEHEMETKAEEVGYKLTLFGPQLDFYLTLPKEY